MKKIKLMQITHDLAIGGLQQVVVNICKSINRDKFEVSVLCLRNLGEFVPEVEKMGINVFLLPQKKNGTDYFSFLKVAKILRQEKTDVIHTHNTQPFIEGTLGALLSGVKTIVHTDHARSYPDKKRYMFAEWLASKFAYKVVGVSNHTSQNLAEFEKISKKKLVTIPNGINIGRYDISIDREQKLMELGIQGRGPIIGLGVRLTLQKGIVYLLQAMPKIIDTFPDIALIIAGDGPYGTELKKAAIDLGIEKHVFFLGPRLDIPEILKILDIYVLPSLWEGLPMVLLEAMAAGCPIIATDVGGNSTVIKSRENGSLVRPASPQALSSEIIKLLFDHTLRSQYFKKGKSTLQNNFTTEIMTRRYEQLYLKQM